MNQEQIQAAYQRAAEVVNGFKRVRDQQARDVVAMAGAIAQRDREIEALEKKVFGLQLQLAGSKQSTASARSGQDFGSIFESR
jgi:tellurite resistance protein